MKYICIAHHTVFTVMNESNCMLVTVIDFLQLGKLGEQFTPHQFVFGEQFVLHTKLCSPL